MIEGARACPFCGSRELGFEEPLGILRVICDGCGTDGPVFEQDPELAPGDWARAEVVLRLWNERADGGPTPRPPPLGERGGTSAAADGGEDVPELGELRVVKYQTGDVIVVRCDDHMSENHCQQIDEYLSRVFPGCSVVILAGGLSIEFAREGDGNGAPPRPSGTPPHSVERGGTAPATATAED